jgi:LCP family protein required for cell wall assembly
MLSIPRDLWVSIPGYAEGRINTAHFLGEMDDYPGGGPALAKKTVQYTLGVPVHYYVRINFDGFERIVDTIGGITIDVPERIYDAEYPDNRYGIITIDIPAGLQHMDGKTALQYARSRHNSSDLSRARRQQQVIKAIANKAVKLDIPLTRIPEILRTLGESVQTDVSLSEMYRLARIGQDLDLSTIRSALVDETMTTPQITPDGAYVLIPDRDKIRELVDEVFDPISPAGEPGLTEKQAIALESARIEVQNGTLIPGLAQQTTDYLISLGYDVTDVGNADRSDYSSTTVIDIGSKMRTISLLLNRLSLPASSVVHAPDAQDQVDIRIILGRDFSTPTPR